MGRQWMCCFVPFFKSECARIGNGAFTMWFHANWLILIIFFSEFQLKLDQSRYVVGITCIHSVHSSAKQHHQLKLAIEFQFEFGFFSFLISICGFSVFLNSCVINIFEYTQWNCQFSYAQPCDQWISRFKARHHELVLSNLSYRWISWIDSFRLMIIWCWQIAQPNIAMQTNRSIHLHQIRFLYEVFACLWMKRLRVVVCVCVCVIT